MIEVLRRDNESVEKLISRYKAKLEKYQVASEVISRRRFNPKGKKHKR